MKEYEYVCIDLLGEIYITPKAKKKYAKQLKLIKTVTNRIRIRGYSIDNYLPEYKGSLFLVIDKSIKNVIEMIVLWLQLLIQLITNKPDQYH